MSRYMIELSLDQRVVLVAGGGRVAQRKLAGLLTTKAEITVVAPEATPWIKARAKSGELTFMEAPFSPDLLGLPLSPLLVYAATSDAERNREIARLCARQGVLCNSADDPGVSGFLVPAVVRQGPVTLAVGTGGRSPALSRLIKERLQRWLEPGWGELTELFGAMREEVRQGLPQVERRRHFWRQTAQAAEREGRFEDGKNKKNREWFMQQLKKMQQDADRKG